MGETIDDGYRSIRLPEDLVKKVEKHIQHGGEGYTSIAEFVKTAIRHELGGGIGG